jgi:hypothetical protein
VSISIPVSELKTALEGFIAAAWPEVVTAVTYERRAEKLLLDKGSSPRAAVVWGEPAGGASWGARVGTFGLSVDVFYLKQSELPGQEQVNMQAKARDLVNRFITAGNRWSGVTDMHGWRLTSSSAEHAKADAWRAAGWASARIALEVEFDYEK